MLLCYTQTEGETDIRGLLIFFGVFRCSSRTVCFQAYKSALVVFLIPSLQCLLYSDHVCLPLNKVSGSIGLNVSAHRFQVLMNSICILDVLGLLITPSVHSFVYVSLFHPSSHSFLYITLLLVPPLKPVIS